jgi:hypothetical protein
MSDILEVFNDEPEVSEAQEVDSSEEASTEAEPETSEESTAEASEETEVAETTTAEEETEKESWTLAAVKDERSKRQEATTRAEQAEARIAELEAQINGTAKETPDVFEDQEGFVNSLRSEMKQDLASAKFELSVELMRDLHSDFDDVSKVFMEAANENPVLKAQAQKSSNPARYVYDQGKKYMQFQEMQNPEAYEAKLRQELEPKVRAELEKKLQAENTDVDLSPSLANARGVSDEKERLSENPGDLF